MLSGAETPAPAPRSGLVTSPMESRIPRRGLFIGHRSKWLHLRWKPSLSIRLRWPFIQSLPNSVKFNGLFWCFRKSVERISFQFGSVRRNVLRFELVVMFMVELGHCFEFYLRPKSVRGSEHSSTAAKRRHTVAWDANPRLEECRL